MVVRKLSSHGMQQHDRLGEMASTRKKLDEKHLKILRNLVALPGNKQCFDCSQRGPTYINTTIGSFVCTSCSGMLRGLTPPHRVKSISMATFTPEEIDFVKSRGNEYCKKVWLNLYEDTNQTHDTKNDQHIKDFMIAKYERKQYYVEPSATNKFTNGVSESANQWIDTSSDDKIRKNINKNKINPVVTLPKLETQTFNKAAMFKNEQQYSSTLSTPGFNLVMTGTNSGASTGAVDPFGPVLQNLTQDQPSFANFDNNPIFNSNSSTATMTSSASFPSATKPRPPSEDRYAALKDLDCIMKMQQEGHVTEWGNSNPESAQTAVTDWCTNTGNNGIWPTDRSVVSSNPFQLTNFNENVSVQTMNNRNPFRTNVVETTDPWCAFPSSQSTNSFWASTNNNNNNLTIGPASSGKSSNPFL